MAETAFHEGTARALAGQIVAALRALDAPVTEVSLQPEADGLAITAWIRGQLVAVVAPAGRPLTYQTIAVALLDTALQQSAMVADHLSLAPQS